MPSALTLAASSLNSFALSSHSCLVLPVIHGTMRTCFQSCD
jgi:hypothetical protein